MATYVIGDVHGCFKELVKLLDLINYDANRDQLWFVGDLVNRGPNSLEVLRLVKSLKDPIVVLGNHDLYLIALFHSKCPVKAEHNLEPIFSAKDAGELVDWLRLRPLLYFSSERNWVMTHAGIYPYWDIYQAKEYAKEAEKCLQSEHYYDYLQAMYGNKIIKWNENFSDEERFNFIINSFTRMRFCRRDGYLEFKHQGKPSSAPTGYLPWFAISNRKIKNTKIVFGHWAALEDGITGVNNVYALDTGCVWGNKLTAIRLEDEIKFSVNFCD